MICNMLIVSAADFITWSGAVMLWLWHGINHCLRVITWLCLSPVNDEYSMVIISCRGSRLGRHDMGAKMIIINVSQNVCRRIWLRHMLIIDAV